MDLFLAVVRRGWFDLRSPFSPDKLHLHHRLLEIGHSHRRAVLLMWLWAGLIAFEIPSETFVEIRVVFPRNLLTSTAGAEVKEGNGLDKILAEEAEFAANLAKQRRRDEFVRDNFWWLIFVVLLLAALPAASPAQERFDKDEFAARRARLKSTPLSAPLIVRARSSRSTCPP